MREKSWKLITARGRKAPPDSEISVAYKLMAAEVNRLKLQPGEVLIVNTRMAGPWFVLDFMVLTDQEVEHLLEHSERESPQPPASAGRLPYDIEARTQ